MLHAFRRARDRRHRQARAALDLLRIALTVAAHIHLAASQRERAIRTARLLSLLYRPILRARREPLSSLHLQVLFQTAQFRRIVAEFPREERVDSFYINLLAGVAHLYGGSTRLARYFLAASLRIEPGYALAHRMLGRLHLRLGDETAAAKAFRASVALSPETVMAHQNYAGRYDIPGYIPRDWELRDAGRLLIRDNLLQFAEDLVLQGRPADALVYYQRALRYQARLAAGAGLPRRLMRRVAETCRQFDPDLPVRILPYEWVTQFGHIGLLDSRMKMAALGMLPPANMLLLAPAGKVANPAYLACWENRIAIIREEALVSELFPYQRHFGEQFMAFPAGGDAAEPWTRAAARAQIAWARGNLPPLLRLSPRHAAQGRAVLARLGVPADAWFVGLHIREGGFHHDGQGTAGAHRSAGIADYRDAIDAVTERGGWVIRLGDASMSPLPRLPQVIDYAHSAEKSPEADLFFLAASRFVIGTTSGLTTVALSFGTPMLLVNCISNDWQIWTDRTDFLVKPVYGRRQRRILTLAETSSPPIQGCLIDNALMARHGLTAHPNSATDIAAATRHKLDTLSGALPRPGETHPLLRRYRATMAGNPEMFGAALPALPFLQAHPELLAR